MTQKIVSSTKTFTEEEKNLLKENKWEDKFFKDVLHKLFNIIIRKYKLMTCKKIFTLTDKN